jgi:DNA-3-methyladenine glycosylase I
VTDPPTLTRAALATLSPPPEAAALSGDLKRRGWCFVGPTTIYSFMQAMGLVNDHLDGCWVRRRAERRRRIFLRPEPVRS